MHVCVRVSLSLSLSLSVCVCVDVRTYEIDPASQTLSAISTVSYCGVCVSDGGVVLAVRA